MAFLDTESFYRSSCQAGFVKLDAVARNVGWTTSTAWGPVEITINLSKPEKDPRDIAAAANAKASGERGYIDPATGRMRACPLCVEEADVECGYAQPLRIGGEKWGLWYSPYAYYDQHCIAMSWEHRRMHVDRRAFECLFDAVDALPGYFFGSNADLPIVGGSILAHDHFQGGKHVFPMQKAPLYGTFDLTGFPDVEAGVVKWPLSVIRLAGPSRDKLVDAACVVLDAWCSHDDVQAGIVSGFACDGAVRAGSALGGEIIAEPSQQTALDQAGERAFSDGRVKGHNTITPILRKDGDAYQLDLALRCNITSDEHPLGVFHPHEDLHHIKRENIGLIEVMGLAILPPRVQQTMVERGLSQDDVGNLFTKVLEDAGVFKWDAEGHQALRRFIGKLSQG